LVEEVRFSTGGFSVQYGDKLSSVLGLTLGSGRKDRLGGKALVSATQYGFNLEGPFCSRGDFIFSARRSYLDLIFKAAGLPFVPVYTDFNLAATYKLSPHDQLFLMGLGAIDRVDRDQSSAEKRVKNAGIMDNTQNQWITGVNYRRIFQHGYLDLAAGANLNQYRFSQVDSAQIEYFKTRADEYEYTSKLQGYTRLTRKLDLLTGVSFRSISLDNETRFADTIYNSSGQRVSPADLGLERALISERGTYKMGGFAETEYHPWAPVRLKTGVRWDYYAFIHHKNYGSPRALITVQMNNRWTVRGGSGLYHQAPSYVWTANPFNRDLKALRSLMTIVGSDYLLRADLRISAEFYHKRYRDLPAGIQPGVTDYLVISNTGTGFGGREDDFQSFGYLPLQSVGKGSAYGFELVAQKKYSETPYYGQAALSWNRSRYRAYNGRDYPGQYDQRVIFNLSGGYRLNAAWEFSGKFRLFTGIPYTPVYVPSEATGWKIQRLPEEYLSRRLKTGHQLDLRADHYINYKSWKLTLFVDIQNIYNVKVPTRPRYDFWEQTTDEADNIGFLPSIGISAEF
ncbi:MAG: TonB-dependent receptor, partial [Candidatus Delongbacteria bacterium]|nr:TonB-dependent receptor [Candidatus Delongbacteria bacterium]